MVQSIALEYIFVEPDVPRLKLMTNIRDRITVTLLPK